MTNERVAGLLSRLASPRAPEAWTEFLNSYAPAVLQVVRLFERDDDHVADCFLFVCERFSEKRFRRLRRFRPDGPAQFSTWLRVVVRNLCLDWHRREFGRNRVFASIARLGKLEQEVFRLRFLEGLSAEETLLAFSPAFRPLGATEIAEAAERVHAALTPRQRWLLEVRRPKVFQSMGRPVESGRATPLEVTDPAPDPETAVLLGQQKDALSRALARLSKRDRLLLRLRFEQELTLAQIARFTGRPSPQQADREIRELLERLGKELA